MKPLIPEEREQYTQKQIKHNPTYINLNMKVAGYNAFRNELLTNLKERGMKEITKILIKYTDMGYIRWDKQEKAIASAIIEALTKGGQNER